MIGPGAYVLAAILLAALVLSLAASAVLLRRRLLPDWEGAPAHLVEVVVGIALLIWLCELLGLLGLLYAWTLVPASLALAGALSLSFSAASPAGGAGGGGSRTPSPAGPPSPRDRTRGPLRLKPGDWAMLITAGVVALVFAHWGLTAKDALDRGIFNFDSLWYHMPFATEMAHSHSVTGLHYTETVFTNWLYPQNSELLHAVGILITERDTLSLFVNFGWLALAFLAAWCIGRPYGRGHLSVAAVAIILASHTLVVREPGAAKNDVVAAALLLAAIAILVNAWGAGRPRVLSRGQGGIAGEDVLTPPAPAPPAGEVSARIGWAVAAAGVATGLAVGTKSTALAIAAALSVAVIVLAPAGRRWIAAAWWFLPAFAAGGFWYLRNLIVTGNPLPQLERVGPLELPHPEQLQSGRPDFSVAHYATDTGVWREYFGPGLEHAFGTLWPLVVGAAVAGAVLAVLRGDRVLRWMGVVALSGMVAYLFTPLSAAGAEGAPTGFAINIRYAIPALLAGLALLPLAVRRPTRDWEAWALLAALLLVLAVTDRSDAVLRDPDRLFGILVAVLAVAVPAALWLAYRRGLFSRGAAAGGFVALALTVAVIGYPLQRDYLGDRFANTDPETSIPGMGLDDAYRWARDVEDARIGLAGTTAGFLQYGFYGTDLSNRVRYIGREGPHAAFNAIPDCRGFRTAVNAADLDYLVTAPFLNFIHPDEPIASPEAGWLRGDAAARPLKRSGTVTVWRLRGRLSPGACGPANAPLHLVPQQPR